MFLQAQGFTGWRSIASLIHHEKQGLIEGYRCLVVTGRAGSVDWSRGRLERRPPFVPGGPALMKRIGMHIDFSTWDGSDFFVPEGTLFTVVHRRVHEMAVKAKLTGMLFTPLDEYEYDDRQATDELRVRIERGLEPSELPGDAAGC